MRNTLLLIVLLGILMPVHGFSKDAKYYWDQGLACYKAGRYEEALTHFLKYAELKPDSKTRYFWIGIAYYGLNQYDEAIENLNNDYDINKNPDIYSYFADIYDAMGNYDTSLQYNLKFVESRPINSDLWYPLNKLGWNYYNLQMYYDAIDRFKESIKIRPAYNSYIGLCEVYMAIGEYDKSREILTKMLSDTMNTEMKVLMGNSYVSQGRYKEAYEIFGMKNKIGSAIKTVENGIKLINMVKNGPADLSGLKNDDILLEFNGIPLNNISTGEFSDELLSQPPFGSKIKLKVYRDGLAADKFIYIGISPEIVQSAMNDTDLVRQRDEIKGAPSRSKLNIAVIELNPHGVSENEASALTARVRSELFNTHKYNVAERENMANILEEQGFQQTGATSDENLVQAGKLLNVQYMLGGSVSKIGQTFSISLKLINVETGGIESFVTEDIQGSMDDVFLRGIRKTVYRLIQ
jgi:tetratricopeptide (TPR) repeat protein